jgi:hypothetical protein
MFLATNCRTLIADLQHTLDPSRFMLIGIEGRMLEGKTQLAKQLQEDLKLHAIHVDDFRPKAVPDLPYLQTLNLPALDAHLNEIQQDFPTMPLIIESICLREVLGAIGRRLDVAIYVKRLSRQGLWNTQFDLEDYENDPRPNVPKVLYDDELRYHLAYRPHEIADFYFEWTE